MRFLAIAVLFALIGCTPPESDTAATQFLTDPLFTPTLETAADTLAFRAASFAGQEAWERTPYLAFRFGRAETEADSASSPASRRHLWNRTTGDYRVDIPRRDTLYTVFLDVTPPTGAERSGTAYRDGKLLSGEEAMQWLDSAHGMFVNDTYWLLAPFKLFDPGVTRGLDPSEDTATEKALTLTFDGVGRTPGDRYWLYVDRQSGRVTGWKFHLQSQPEAGARIDRLGYRTFETPNGTLRIATRHETGDRDLYSDALSLPESVDADAFTDPAAAPRFN